MLADTQSSAFGCVVLLPIQCKMARAALGWSSFDAAKAAGVSAKTISRFENDEYSTPRLVHQIQRTFEEADIRFTVNGRRLGVTFLTPYPPISVSPAAGSPTVQPSSSTWRT